MEFEIDTTLVATIVADEMQLTRVDLAQLGPIAALARSQQRHDARLAAAPDAHTLACKAGCFWCCYFTVEVRPVEVMRIVEFMQHEMLLADRERISAEIHTNSAALATLDEDARLRHNLKCPFLHFGRCSIYAVRPQTCRNYHATNAAGCEKAYKEPDNDDIDPEFAPLVYQTGGAHVDAFSTALHEAGYDTAAYELNAALAVALTDPAGTRTRFGAKQSTFPTIERVEVMPEFVDPDE
jgi:Fe-S-cluster containining protein